MFIERLSSKYNNDEPIFTENILELFSDYSRAQVFRFIKKAKNNKEIIQFDKGIYYIPRFTFWGNLSTIAADDVVAKRYLRNGQKIYGVYSGIKLLNSFSVTTQMAAIIEIVSNNETTRRRVIEINGRKFVLRKSRCEINSNNYAAYTILQLFNDLNDTDELNNSSKRRLLEYIKKKNVTQEKLLNMSVSFSSKATKNLIRSGIINAITKG